MTGFLKELPMLVSMWAPRVKPGSSAKATNALSGGAMSSAPKLQIRTGDQHTQTSRVTIRTI